VTIFAAMASILGPASKCISVTSPQHM